MDFSNAQQLSSKGLLHRQRFSVYGSNPRWTKTDRENSLKNPRRLARKRVEVTTYVTGPSLNQYNPNLIQEVSSVALKSFGK
jgi:hypothetical protein